MMKLMTQRSQQVLQDRCAQLASLEVAFIGHPSFRRKPRQSELNDLNELLSEASDQAVRETLTESGISVSATPLLDKDEEALLFRMMNYYKCRVNRLRAKLKVEEPDRSLIAQIEESLRLAERIRDRIVLANLRLVVSIARRLAGARYSFEEIISDGNFILIRAIDKFDFSKGFRFSTYATHAIQRDVFRKFKRITRRSDVVQGASQATLEEQPDQAETPEEYAQQERVVCNLQQLIEAELDDRERFIIQARFGLEDKNSPLRLRSIAEELGLSKERVRQLQNRAIEKLQSCINWDAVL